jgi:hypothetical protein
MRLWLQRHHIVGQSPAGRRRRLIVVLSALVAMAFGAGVTLAFTSTSQHAATPPRPKGASALQVATENRHDAAVWVASQVSQSVIVSCDPQMCPELQSAGFPPTQLMILQSTAPDPLGSEVVIATPAIQSQFGARLASVYAPEVLASFGSGAERIDVRYIPPDGTNAFNAQLAADRSDRIAAGGQLLTNQHLQTSPTARSDLRNGRVDPRLLVTLSPLAAKMSIQLVTFEDSSPGESSAVPLRGAEIGAATSADLSAILAFVKAQRTNFASATAFIGKSASGQPVVIVRYDAPGPMDVGGP